MNGTATSSAWKRFWDRGGFWRAVLLAVGYLALYLAAGRLIGATLAPDIADDAVFDSAENVFYAIAAAIIVGIVLLFLFAWSIRWLGELFGRQPIGGSWWMWILPGLILAFNLAKFAGTDYDPYDTSTIVAVLVTGLLIGLAEELLTRGFVVNLMRRGGYKEWTVMVVSSLVFALLHASNLLSGQDLSTVGATVLYAFSFGVAMYLTLRVTGHLIWPILLHASTDPSTMLAVGGVDKVTGGGTDLSTLAALGIAGNSVVIILGLVFMWFVRGAVDSGVYAASRDLTALPA